MTSLPHAFPENPQVLVPRGGETPWPSSSEFYWLVFHGTLICMLIGLAYHTSLGFMARSWVNDENYSHGILVPAVSAFLIWKKRHDIFAQPLVEMWWGITFLLGGLGLYVVGELATLYILLHISLWFVLVGLVISLLGTSVT